MRIIESELKIVRRKVSGLHRNEVIEKWNVPANRDVIVRKRWQAHGRNGRRTQNQYVIFAACLMASWNLSQIK